MLLHTAIAANVDGAVVKMSEQKHNNRPCQGQAGPSRTATPVQRPGPGSATSGPCSYAPCPGQSTAGREPGGGREEGCNNNKGTESNLVTTHEDNIDEDVRVIKITIIIKFNNQYPHILYTLRLRRYNSSVLCNRLMHELPNFI